MPCQPMAKSEAKLDIFKQTKRINKARTSLLESVSTRAQTSLGKADHILPHAVCLLLHLIFYLHI